MASPRKVQGDLSSFMRSMSLWALAGVIVVIGNILFLPQPGENPVATLFYAIAGPAWIVGGIYLVWDFFRGTKVSTPRDTLRTFYRSVGIDAANWRRAFECLTDEGKANFGSVEDFADYWRQVKREYGLCGLRPDLLEIAQREGTADASFVIEFTKTESGQMSQTCRPQRKQLRLVEGDWLLSSGDVS